MGFQGHRREPHSYNRSRYLSFGPRRRQSVPTTSDNLFRVWFRGSRPSASVTSRRPGGPSPPSPRDPAPREPACPRRGRPTGGANPLARDLCPEAIGVPGEQPRERPGRSPGTRWRLRSRARIFRSTRPTTILAEPSGETGRPGERIRSDREPGADGPAFHRGKVISPAAQRRCANATHPWAVHWRVFAGGRRHPSSLSRRIERHRRASTINRARPAADRLHSPVASPFSGETPRREATLSVAAAFRWPGPAVWR